MSWWLSHVLIVWFCVLCFTFWPLKVCAVRQPSFLAAFAPQRRLLSTLRNPAPNSPVSLTPLPLDIASTTLSLISLGHAPPSGAPMRSDTTRYLLRVASPPPAVPVSTGPAPPPVIDTPGPASPPLNAFTPSPTVSPIVPTSAPPTYLNGPAPSPNATAPSPTASSTSPGCCSTNMIARPGSKASDCQCVYPIKVVFEMDNASSAFTNLTSQFQHELASQLALSDLQVQIQAFQFGNNFTLNMVVNIGPLTGLSFSESEIGRINKSLVSHSVHFSSILFSNYTVVNVTAYMPPPPPSSVSGPGIAPTAPPPFQSGSSTAGGKSTSGIHWHRWLIGVVAGGGSLILLILACVIWRVLVKKRDGKYPDSINKAPAVSAVPTTPETSSKRMVTTREKSIPRPSNTRDFSYEELQEATNDFSPDCFIGEGGFGKVYRGVLKDGTEVAIKKLTSGGNQGDKEFMVEVEMLSRLHHRHLVKLLGFYCSLEPLQQLLCYELVPNGSLESWLHGPLSLSRGPLDWNTRMKIALGAARGLAYLHEDSQPCVIHRDFKASNILLEYNFNPKVADFGLARSAPEGQQDYVSTRVMGTFGYVAPEYAMTGHLLVKSDVYSYGVVLLELLSGRKPVDYSRPSGEENIVAWARPLVEIRTKLHELADPRMGGKYPADDFAQVAAIARACVAPEWSERPTMGEVVQQLKSVTRTHEYASSRDAERGMSSEGEKEGPVDTPTSASASTRSFATTRHTHRPTVTTFGSDGSSSMFSSGPFSGLIGIENDPLSRTTVISEDLHEGR